MDEADWKYSYHEKKKCDINDAFTAITNKIHAEPTKKNETTFLISGKIIVKTNTKQKPNINYIRVKPY